jgi:hypothetical protein
MLLEEATGGPAVSDAKFELSESYKL